MGKYQDKLNSMTPEMKLLTTDVVMCAMTGPRSIAKVGDNTSFTIAKILLWWNLLSETQKPASQRSFNRQHLG